ncbi:ParB N-terminal domain-containing protein [Nocardia arthritidis]|nr:ParB N-terminal domain-containing protein [Nocardia arthritidis]
MSAGLSDEGAFSAASSIHELPLCSNIVDLPISDVLPSDSPPRAAGLNAAHVRMLADSATAFPPIVVHRGTMQVIDGWHRLRAVQLRGEATISAVLFDGGQSEAFILAVKLNAAHGLPLSLADRKAAALRILLLYPDWSDRSVATIAGISRGTVAVIRNRSTGKFGQSTGRIARNGVLHRPNVQQGRRRAAELFAADPSASTRKVAMAAGISVTTAKDVRKQLRVGEQPISSRRSDNGAASMHGPMGRSVRNVPTSAPRKIDADETLQRLRRDPSLRFTETGRKLLRWLEIPFERGVDWSAIVRSLPDHCTHGIAELARQRSEEWRQLAYLLDQR